MLHALNRKIINFSYAREIRIYQSEEGKKFFQDNCVGVFQQEISDSESLYSSCLLMLANKDEMIHLYYTIIFLLLESILCYTLY